MIIFGETKFMNCKKCGTVLEYDLNASKEKDICWSCVEKKDDKVIATTEKVDEREIYESMKREDKILAEIQAQTRDVRNIKSNVQFFFWLTIIGIILQIWYVTKYVL